MAEDTQKMVSKDMSVQCDGDNEKVVSLQASLT